MKRTWLVLVLSPVVMLPIAMNGTFAGEELALELSISAIGVAIALTVLLRFGFLAEVVMFYTLRLALSVLGFVASRGDEPLFGRTILD